jgi:hypothetical protein
MANQNILHTALRNYPCLGQWFLVFGILFLTHCRFPPRQNSRVKTKYKKTAPRAQITILAGRQSKKHK